MIRVGIVVSGIHKALAFEWIASNIDASRFELHFFLLNHQDSTIEQWLKARKFKVTRVPIGSKWLLIKAVLALYYLFSKYRIQVVHTHLFEASLAGLLAAKLAGVKRRIMTRHYADLNHIYYKKLVPYDQFCNALATHIIAPSALIKNILVSKERLQVSKIHLVHHGFDIALFQHPDPDKVARLRRQYIPDKAKPVIGVIARYTELKGIQHIIPAFEGLLSTYPNAHLLLANTQGDYASTIKKQLSGIQSKHYTEISFEEEVWNLYPLFDLYVHVPIGPTVEGFGQTYVESLLARIPLICTLSGVGSEFLEHNRNCVIVPYCNPEAIQEAMERLLTDIELRTRIQTQGSIDAQQQFMLDPLIQSLQKLYRL